MSDYTDALKAQAADVESRATAIRSTMEAASALPACRVVLAALDGDVDQVNSLIGEAPYEYAISLMTLFVSFGAAVCGGDEQLRSEVVVLAAAQEMELP